MRAFEPAKEVASFQPPTWPEYVTSRVRHRLPAGMASNGELLVLMLSNGMSFGELAAVIEELKNKSKGAGTHARRELYWQAYTKLAGMCVHVYRA